MKQILITSLFLAFISIEAKAQTPLTGSQAYDKAQNLRAQARKFYNKDNPPKADCDSALAILNTAVNFLDQPEVIELAQDNLYLKGRKSDVYYDIILCYTLSKQYDKALDIFDKMGNEGNYYRIEFYETGSLFMPIRSNPRFQSALSMLKFR